MLVIAEVVGGARLHVLNGSQVNTFTFSGLAADAEYSISIHAFQDLQGPSSLVLHVKTLSSELMLSQSHYGNVHE